MSEAEQLHTNEELGTDEIGEELAPSEAVEKTKAPEGFIRAEDAQKDINKQHRKFRDEERARKKLEADAESLRRELEELKAKDVDVTVPPIPDRYDEDYEQKILARDEAIQRRTAHEAELSHREAQSLRVQEAQQAAQAERERELVAGFDANMVKIGLNPIEVSQAANRLIDYGVSDTLQDVFLEDPDGPLFVAYFDQHPIELEALGSMSALQLVKHLDGTVRAKASLLRPKTSNAPEPPITLSGGGVKELDEPLLRGATFT